MRSEIFVQEYAIGENTKLIKRLWKIEKSDHFPEGLEFAYQVIYLKDGRWIQVVRIDNQMHENKPGTHVHILSREQVIWEHIQIDDVEEKIIEISQSIIKNILEKI